MTTPAIAHPPATLEGWYALHQVFRIDGERLGQRKFDPMINGAASALRRAANLGSASKSRKKTGAKSANGWSCVARVIGSTADIMVIHFRDSLDAIGDAQDELRATPLSRVLAPVCTFLSVTEAGLYHITAEIARETQSRGGKVGDEVYSRSLAERSATEWSSPHVARRLFPELPSDMPYVCFYPMSKRRDASQNWYTLSLDERSKLMQAHGLTGRRYAGKVQQVITGAIGLDAWEWGVTLFAKDPLEFKKLVTDMRFDEVSAKYAEFGDFYVGKIVTP
ncbi:MAG: hydrogen peroxide-dependent heme synthase [Gemmatimonadaceae bacterium]